MINSLIVDHFNAVYMKPSFVQRSIQRKTDYKQVAAYKSNPTGKYLLQKKENCF